MNPRIVYLILSVTISLSACSAGLAVTIPTVKVPDAQATSASAPVVQTSSSRPQTTAPVGGANGGTPLAEAIGACTGKSAQASW
jgi:hypothetical protein